MVLTNNNKFRYLVLIYLLAVHCAVGALVMQGNYVSKLHNKVAMLSVLNDYAERMHRRKLETVLLGDSITWGLGDAPNSRNKAFSGAVSQDVLNLMPKLDLKADEIFLLIGTNDVWIGKSGLAERLAEIEALLPPGVPVVWSGIMPAKDFRIDPQEIKDANLVIRKLCAKHEGCVYLDTWSILADVDGNPIASYYLPDGVHLSAEGYAAWINALLNVNLFPAKA